MFVSWQSVQSLGQWTRALASTRGSHSEFFKRERKLSSPPPQKSSPHKAACMRFPLCKGSWLHLCFHNRTRIQICPPEGGAADALSRFRSITTQRSCDSRTCSRLSIRSLRPRDKGPYHQSLVLETVWWELHQRDTHATPLITATPLELTRGR